MLKRILNLTYGLLASAALCVTSQAGVVFTDNFDNTNNVPGATYTVGTRAEFLAHGWTAVYGTPQGEANANLGVGIAGSSNPPESTFWGNAGQSGNSEAALEYNYMGATVNCGDIIKIEANAIRLTAYTYIEEIILWDGSNPATRVTATNWTGLGVSDQWPGWWTPPQKGAINTLVYNATAADAGKYVIFKYGHGSSWSETADVTFSITPVTVPALTAQPKPLVRTEGEPASFAVEALGCGLTYQWYKGASPVEGGTASQLVFNPVALANAGDYYCTIANGSGSTNSQTVTLTVDPKLSGGASISLGINFEDEAPWNPTPTAPAYGLHQSRWQDTPPGSEGGPVAQNNLLYPFGAGQIDLSYMCANTYSVPGAVETLPPGNAQVNYGYLDDSSAGYSVTIVGLTNSVGFTSYVVRTIAASDNATNFNTVALTENAGYTTQDLTYGPVFPANPSGGQAAVSTASAALNVDSITLTSTRLSGTLTRGCLAGVIITDKPVILANPQAPTNNVFSGGSFSLSADVFGVPPLACQWKKDGTNVPGATTATYARPSATPSDSGVYTLLVTNAFGTATSLSATVTVVSYFPPVILQQPVPRTVYASRTARFTVAADGGQLSYQWKKGGTVIDGATTASLTLSGVTALDEADYSCYVSNPAGNTNSASAHLTVAAVPTTGYLGKVLADGPVTLWRLGETSGTTAYDKWSANDATYSGTFTLGTAGLITGDADTAVTLVPTAKAMAPFASALNNPAGPFSVEFWALPTTAGQECIISSQKRTSGRAGFTIFMNNGGSGFSALLGNNAGGTVFVNGATTVQAGVRYHVVVTYDNTTAKVYVNGKLDASAAIPFDASGFEPNPDAPFQIGARNNGDGFGYNGVVDEVAVYNYALTASQVQQHTLAVLPLTVALAPTTGIVVNERPTPPVHGQNFGATWAASESDGATNRAGVMQFNATNGNQIVVSGYPQLDSTVGTICFWVRSITNAGSGSEAAMIMDRRETGGGGSGTVIAINDNGTVFFQANPTGANPFSSFGVVNDGLWHHVAVTYGQNIGDIVAIYLDGAWNNHNANVSAWWWPSGMSMLLGKSRDGYWKKLHGSLDDVRFYNRVLTDVEIGQVMTSGAVVDAAALTLRLNFDAAPVSGYRVTTAPLQGTVQGSGTVGSGYAPLGPSPCLYIPSGSAQFFRAVVP